MDDLDLEILKRCLPGDQQFNLRGESDEETEVFNEWGDRLLALRDRGFLDIPNGLIVRNHQGGVARYHRIGVRRVTAEGRRELRRHEPPDATTVQTIRAKIDQDIADRRRLLEAGYGKLASRFIPRSGAQASRSRYQYIPPIPPPAAARAGFSSFFSTKTHSVVSRSPAIDAAFWSAVRVTLVGSMTPALTRSS